MKINFNMKKFDFKKPDIGELKDFYDKNRQKILTVFVILSCIFFIFYWTGNIINSKKRSASVSAEAAYERWVKAADYSAKIKRADFSAGRRLTTGLPSFLQTAGGNLGIGEKLVNIRPVSSGGNIEQASVRLENLYYDEFINFIAALEGYDNLKVKSLSFSRRYDNPSMIDVSMEIVKS